MTELCFPQKVFAALLGAAIAVPSVAMGFYTLYQVVTFIGN